MVCQIVVKFLTVSIACMIIPEGVLGVEVAGYECPVADVEECLDVSCFQFGVRYVE